MPLTYQGRRIAHEGHRFGVVAAAFNELVVERLIAGCVEGFARHGVGQDRIEIARVPGSYEVPLVARVMASSGRFAAVVCLGAVVRGETAHFDYVAGPTASGVASVAAELGVPCVFGILTTETLEQALDRAGGKAGNKGFEAAVTALEMADLLVQLRASR